MTKNAQVAANAITLAEFLAKYPDLPEPTHYDVQWDAPQVRWLIWDKDLDRQRATAEAVVRFLPGTATKSPSGDDWFKYSGEVDGVQWDVTAKRDAVCRRVVTGVEVVTRMVPDPSISVPLVEIDEHVEIVEWKCEPLLADAAVAS